MLIIPKTCSKWNIFDICSDLILRHVSVTHRPILVWPSESGDPSFTWELRHHVTSKKGSTQMGYSSVFSASFKKISVFKMNPNSPSGLEWRSETDSLFSSVHGPVHVRKASRDISDVVARTGWNGQKQLQTVWRLTFQLSNVWCLKKRKELNVDIIFSASFILTSCL